MNDFFHPMNDLLKRLKLDLDNFAARKNNVKPINLEK